MLLLNETRSSYLYMCTMVETLEDHRYLDRSFLGPTTYVSVSDTKIVEILRPMGVSEFRECFRMSREELRRLYEYVGDHPVFYNDRGRHQRHPMIQLTVFLYRLGSGNRLSDVQRTLGRISRGSIIQYTLRATVAIISKFAEVVAWPGPMRRLEIETFFADKYRIPGCVGFIDGSHIILHKSPSFGIEKNAKFWSRKKRYGLLILAVCDEKKRFTYLQTGHYASANDFRAQRSSAIAHKPLELFSGEQYVLGDSGFYCDTYLVPMYRRTSGQQDLPKERAEFNDHVAKARVKIEHAFGILKQRWLMLNDMHKVLKEQHDLTVAFAIIQAAVVLHNLFIDTSALHWDLEEFEAAKRRADELQAKMEKDEGYTEGMANLVDPSDARPARRERLRQSIHWLLQEEPRTRRRAAIRERRR